MKYIIYSLACLTFSIVIGGAVYEHLAVVPQWSAAPPASLAMFQGEYGLNPGPFWMMIHPVTLLFMISTLVLFWKTPAKKNISITLISYIAILASTFIYFVPELMSIVTTPFTTVADPELTSRAQLWETLSIIRLFILIILAVIFSNGIARSSRVN